MKNTNSNVPARRPSLNRPFGLAALLVCACLLGSTAYAQTQYRTTIDKEEGGIFQHPEGFPWTDYGIYDGTPQSPMDPAAIWIEMAHFDQFYSAEDNTPYGIPYSKLRAYESQQVAEGKPPIFITATYKGKKRPVYFSWSLSLVNNKPTAASNQWQYAVNVQDTRFIHFWINHYIQPLLTKSENSSRPNMWLQLDECAFIYTLYGVLDDNNNFVSGVTWDSPFPQNQAQFETGIETFFSQVRTALAPNINVIVNVGSQANPSHFPTIFANVPGIFTENLYSWVSSDAAYNRNAWYQQNFQYFPWMASQNRVTLMRAEIPSSDSNGLLSSFAIYELLKGLNSFFAPGDMSSNNTMAWQTWAARLGKPLAAMTTSSPTSEGTGFRLFSRNYEGGIVYLNGTGTTQTIQLSPSTTYYDPNGNQLTSHSIKVLYNEGTFVTTNPHAIPPPQISPRHGSTMVWPVSVTMESDTSGATIHYTLDGSTPTTSSPKYTGPISISSSTVVNARAFTSTQSSLSSTANYSVTSSATAQFFLSSDSGLSGSYYPVVQLSAIPKGTVEVFYSVVNGTPANGTYTFLPGTTYGTLPITTGSSGTMKVTLTGATGAGLGSKDVLEYTIVN
jgi:Chitobiase/beta-hexosaminidase C-terminal domain